MGCGWLLIFVSSEILWFGYGLWDNGSVSGFFFFEVLLIILFLFFRIRIRCRFSVFGFRFTDSQFDSQLRVRCSLVGEGRVFKNEIILTACILFLIFSDGYMKINATISRFLSREGGAFTVSELGRGCPPFPRLLLLLLLLVLGIVEIKIRYSRSYSGCCLLIGWFPDPPKLEYIWRNNASPPRPPLAFPLFPYYKIWNLNMNQNMDRLSFPVRGIIC